MSHSTIHTEVINNFCDIAIRTNCVPSPHLGQLLLMIGILTDDVNRIRYAFQNYPQDSNPEKQVDPYVLNILVQLQLLSHQDLIEVERNNSEIISSINNDTP